MKLLCSSPDLGELEGLLKRLVAVGIPCAVCKDSPNSQLSVWIQQDHDFPLALRIFSSRATPRRLPHWACALDSPPPAAKKPVLPPLKRSVRPPTKGPVLLPVNGHARSAFNGPAVPLLNTSPLSVVQAPPMPATGESDPPSMVVVQSNGLTRTGTV